MNDARVVLDAQEGDLDQRLTAAGLQRMEVGMLNMVTGKVTLKHSLSSEVSEKYYPVIDGRAMRTGQDVIVAPVNGTLVVLGPVIGAGPDIYVCTGTPEGQIPSAIGSICLRTDGGAGTSLYVKESGANTLFGWVPAVYTPPEFIPTRYILSTPGAGTFDSFGFPGVATTGTIGNADDSAFGPLTSLSTGSVSGNTASLISSSVFLRGWALDLEIYIRMASPTAMRLWLGFTSGSLTGADDGTVNALAFRFSTVAGDSNWQAYANDGGAPGTIVDTGVAVSASAGYLLRIRALPDNSGVEYYINDELITTISTNLPGTATAMAFATYITTAAAAIKTVRVGRVALAHRG